MAVTHLVCVVSGGLNVHGVAAMALVAASDAAPSRTGEIARDRYASNFDCTDMCGCLPVGTPIAHQVSLLPSQARANFYLNPKRQRCLTNITYVALPWIGRMMRHLATLAPWNVRLV